MNAIWTRLGLAPGRRKGWWLPGWWPAAQDSPAGTKREGARQEGNPGFRARDKAFAD